MMDGTQQRLRELIYVTSNDPNWTITVRDLGICLTYYTDSGHVVHKIVAWEDITTARSNPLLFAKREIENIIKNLDDDDG